MKSHLVCLLALLCAGPAFAQPKKEPAARKFIEAQQIKLFLGPADADQLDDGPWGVSLSFYARFLKDGAVDRGNQGLIYDSVTNDEWGFHATLAPLFTGSVSPLLTEHPWLPDVTARIEGQIASSYVDGKPEFSADGKIVTQKLSVKIERKLRTFVTASFAQRKHEFFRKERSHAVSFDVVMKMKAGQYSVSAEPPSKDSLGSDGWAAKSVTKIGRLARDPEPRWLGLGAAKCRAELSTRMLPNTDGPPAEKILVPGKAFPKKLPG
ncbi:MAG: hypothetical protein HY289_15295 [Planctomycetes bacterium]|nr:hypothetical protein [Planctomycetota bacterium]